MTEKTKSDSQKPDAVDYSKTLYLPQTDFPMRANLSQREPEQLAFWERIGVYRRSLEVNEGGETFILHDGPPYANGHIHMGTAFNKVFKDLIVKYKTMRGYWSPYVPGWDCHGQPIEHQVEKNLGPEKLKTIARAEMRVLGREAAGRFVGGQSEAVRRPGGGGAAGQQGANQRTSAWKQVRLDSRRRRRAKRPLDPIGRTGGDWLVAPQPAPQLGEHRPALFLAVVAGAHGA